ncbi:hypothetical protein FHQ26_05610 [Testudinibacter sp. TR-2022]|nr:hypothetical protein FHQ22_00285 [Pasteurellaceae bacterium Phil31]TNH08856.1 hypothetical protein FHQ30_01800 [Pasteurellaceae bacterium Phil11]TNH10204.1 hypothetical protein FHQ26_05610 [Testudinibacter sp. TR-2022]TNH11831.1 hypothetical protein FHQ25_01935 [Testudinibacter sp. TR-2022]TNH12451.1 hypothetical protein FIA56_09905 [Testudinibacter sp. TR-2022]
MFIAIVAEIIATSMLKASQQFTHFAPSMIVAINLFSKTVRH